MCVSVIWLSGSQCIAGSRLDELLTRTGKLVELFWQQVPSFTCTEQVSQEKIGKRGKIEYKKDSVFDYLALTKTAHGDDLTVEETRLPQKKTRERPNKPPLLATNGFPTLQLIFHPLYQANYQYQMEQDVEKGKLLAIRFAHIPGLRSTCALVLQERVYALDLQGTAWIDAETGAIQKMTASLIAPLKDINIKSLDVVVVYKPQTFASEPEVRWLPSTATIDVQTALQHWRNIHLFSQYKRFTVQSLEEISK